MKAKIRILAFILKKCIVFIRKNNIDDTLLDNAFRFIKIWLAQNEK